MTSANYDRSRKFFTYRADHPAPINGYTVDQWESLSPGMRREIVRSYERRPDQKFTVTIENISSEEILRLTQFLS